jgi:hypothetical protein
MAKVIREYQIRPMVCGWALDIPMGNTTFVLHFNSRNNAELVKAILEWEDSHPNEAIPYQPTLTPPNEPLTLEKLREMGGQPYWHVGLREESPPPHWNILDPFCAKRIEDYKYGENWIAYRRPPEGEADA